MLRPLFAQHAYSQPATLMGARKLKAPLWSLSVRSHWAHPAILLSGTKVDGSPMACDLLVYVVSASHCVRGYDK
jgi:hypothetical protein